MQPVRISLGPRPADTDDGPFAMLEACHARMDRMLALLDKLRAHVRRHGADAQARQAARDVMRYFDMAAPEHHRDEELHVFPALLRSGSAPAVALAQRLAQEHRAMERLWAGSREVLARLADDRMVFDTDADAALAAFTTECRTHVQTEDSAAFPESRALLSAEALAAMQSDMQRRRGLG